MIRKRPEPDSGISSAMIRISASESAALESHPQEESVDIQQQRDHFKHLASPMGMNYKEAEMDFLKVKNKNKNLAEDLDKGRKAYKKLKKEHSSLEEDNKKLKQRDTTASTRTQREPSEAWINEKEVLESLVSSQKAEISRLEGELQSARNAESAVKESRRDDKDPAAITDVRIPVPLEF